jgi:hypothetical protein
MHQEIPDYSTYDLLREDFIKHRWALARMAGNND